MGCGLSKESPSGEPRRCCLCRWQRKGASTALAQTHANSTTSRTQNVPPISRSNHRDHRSDNRYAHTSRREDKSDRRDTTSYLDVIFGSQKDRSDNRERRSDNRVGKSDSRKDGSDHPRERSHDRRERSDHLERRSDKYSGRSDSREHRSDARKDRSDNRNDRSGNRQDSSHNRKDRSDYRNQKVDYRATQSNGRDTQMKHEHNDSKNRREGHSSRHRKDSRETSDKVPVAPKPARPAPDIYKPLPSEPLRDPSIKSFKRDVKVTKELEAKHPEPTTPEHQIEDAENSGIQQAVVPAVAGNIQNDSPLGDIGEITSDNGSSSPSKFRNSVQLPRGKKYYPTGPSPYSQESINASRAASANTSQRGRGSSARSRGYSTSRSRGRSTGVWRPPGRADLNTKPGL
ncbi:hypothetical protein EDC01DRAFT_634132 [Geopyxis carbonaria]|nr:hypothetical protein EDC01DRAFT_634132 [Geopyxis carbonaria]